MIVNCLCKRDSTDDDSRVTNQCMGLCGSFSQSCSKAMGEEPVEDEAEFDGRVLGKGEEKSE